MLASGCAADGSSDRGSVAAPAPTSDATTSSAARVDSTTPPAVVSFPSPARGCHDLEPGTYLGFVTFEVDQPVTLVDAGLVGARRISVTRSWVADVRGRASGTGMLDMSALPDDYEGALRWETREPVEGHQSEPRDLQALVLELRVSGRGGYRGWALQYEEDGTPATARFEESLRVPCRSAR
jgi:hypothetical protein